MSAQSRKSATPATFNPSASVESVLRHMDEQRAELVDQLAELQNRLEQLDSSKALLLTYIGSSGGAPQAPEGSAEKADEPEAAAATATVPGARRAASSTGRRTGTRTARSGATGRGKSRKKSPAPKAGSTGRGRRGQVIVDYLAEHGEPRSATEVTATLQERHPEEEWSRAGVRESLEHLVSKNQAQRTTQGRSVFYSVAAGDAAVADATVDNDADSAGDASADATATS